MLNTEVTEISIENGKAVGVKATTADGVLTEKLITNNVNII